MHSLKYIRPILFHRTHLNPCFVRVSLVSNFHYYKANPVFLEKYKQKSLDGASSILHHNILPINFCYLHHVPKCRQLSTGHGKEKKDDSQEDEEPPEKLSLIKRYKKMFKEYWYVLVPVHMVTSAIWFGSFYYASTCGLDIIPFLEYINLPESLIKPLRNSSLGHIAVASAMYKLATPARYMVTVGGSTFTVNILKKRGLIRPVPTKAEIKTIIQKKLKKDGTSEKD